MKQAQIMRTKSGLYICHGISSNMMGRVWIMDEFGALVELDDPMFDAAVYSHFGV